MNIIRADMYAIFRGKILYVTLAVLLAFNFLVIATAGAFEIYFSEFEGADLVPEPSFDLIGVAELLYTQTANLVFFLLPLILAVAVPIFTHNTVKNDLAWGFSRTKLYFSKLLLAIVLCAFLLFFYMATGMLIAAILNGIGGPIPDGYFRNLFLTLGAQLVMLIAMTCIGVFLVFTTKRTAAVNGIYITFCLVPSLIIMIFFQAGFDVYRLLEFDVFQGINYLGFHDQLDQRALINIMGTGVFYVVATTFFGILLFKRAEIK